MTRQYPLDTGSFPITEAVLTIAGIVISVSMIVSGALQILPGGWNVLLLFPGFIGLVLSLGNFLYKAPRLITRKKIRASLVLKTDSDSYRPEKTINLSVSLVAEQDFFVREAKV